MLPAAIESRSEFFAQPCNRLGKPVGEPKPLAPGLNTINIRGVELEIGFLPRFNEVLFGSDMELRQAPATKSATRHPEEEAYFKELKPGENIRIVKNVKGPFASPRQLQISRRA